MGFESFKKFTSLFHESVVKQNTNYCQAIGIKERVALCMRWAIYYSSIRSETCRNKFVKKEVTIIRCVKFVFLMSKNIPGKICYIFPLFEVKQYHNLFREQRTFYCTVSKYSIALRYRHVYTLLHKSFILVKSFLKYFLLSLYNEVKTTFKIKILLQKLTLKYRQW
jgi:hypothetical protein